MSRTVRQKSNVTPTKKKARRNSTMTDTTSDDDDYAGVDAISDSEEDEPDVEEAEEQAIIESEDEDEQPTPRPNDGPTDDDQTSWDGFEDPEEILGENVQFFDDHISRGYAPDPDVEAMALFDTEEDLRASRRVHFAAEDSSSSEDEENAWPDLFVPQSSLDPSFRRAIENNDDDFLGASSDGEGSYWDFNGEEPSQQQTSTQTNGEDDDSSSDGTAGSSGYESM
jgi:hypothetical protein